jgi:hypothetical protein
MKKQNILIIVIIVLAIAAFTEVIFIVTRSTDTVVLNDSETDWAEPDKEVTETTTTAPREPELDEEYPQTTWIIEYNFPEYSTYSGNVIKISCTDDFYEYDSFNNYSRLPNDIKIEFSDVDDEDYADYLMELLEKNETAEADEKIDLFLLKPEYAAEFLNSDYVIPLSELGITNAELSDQFDFAKDLASDDNGVQKGFMYKLYPEVFIYNRDVAKEVLGTDEPAKVAEYVKDLETFDKTAETMKKSGYYMLGSYEDTYKTFLGNGRTDYVYENGELIVPDTWKEWAESVKPYATNGYIVPAFRKTEIYNDMKDEGKVFGYIGNSDYAEFWLRFFSDEDDDWAICPAPTAAYSEGVILCAANGTDNVDYAADIMRYMINDKENLKYIAREDKVLTNSVSSMNELYDENGAVDFLGGNETLKTYIDTANNIKGAKSEFSNNSYIFDYYAYYVGGYLTGDKTYDESLVSYFEHASYVFEDIAKPTMEGFDEPLNIKVETDTFAFNPLLY